MTFLRKHRTCFILIANLFVHLFLHLPHFSLDLMGFHAWRQCQTVATAVNFYEEDLRIWNPRRDCREDSDGIFRVEFPLFQWSIAAFGKLTSYHPSQLGRKAAYVAFLIAIGGMAFFLTSVFSRDPALLAGAAFLWSPALFYYSVSPLPDMLALGLGVWGLGFWMREKPMIASLFLGVASAVKLPFLLLWALPMGEKLLQRPFRKPLLSMLGYFSLSFLLTALWYVQATDLWRDKGLVKGIFAADFSTGVYFRLLYHHLFSLLPENIIGYASCVPFLLGLRYIWQEKEKWRGFFSLGVVLLLYLLYELPTLGYPHDYYLFPWLPWTSLAIGKAFDSWWRDRKYGWIALFIITAPVGAWIRMHHRWDPSQPGFNPDLLRYKKELQAAVPDSERVIIGIDQSRFIYAYHIHKKGWCIADEREIPSVLETALRKGVHYLYSDSRILDSIAAPHIQAERGKWGSFRVYELR
ncbi:MAG: hypothetical protein N2170_00920 [Bacteroidia bacterium]|nr:hypothetical protein [Bacteroidia bacterium]